MKERRSNRVRDGPLQGVIKMKKWIVMLAMLSLLTACAQAPEPESAELTGAVGSDIRKRRSRRNTCTNFNCRADSDTYSHAGADRNTRRRHPLPPRADSCPYAGTHGSADGRTCPGAGQYELWCCAL